MNEHSAGPAETALELRRAFDAGFARAPDARESGLETLLALRIGGAPHAVRTSEIAGLFERQRVIPLPSPYPEFLGIAGFQGSVVPVYDLARLLGIEPTPVPAWRLLVRAPEPLALAFESFEGQFPVPREDLAHPPSGEGGERSRRAVRVAGLHRPVVEVSAVVAAIRRLVRELEKER